MNWLGKRGKDPVSNNRGSRTVLWIQEGRRLGHTESDASMWWRTTPEGLDEMIEWGFLLITEL